MSRRARILVSLIALAAINAAPPPASPIETMKISRRHPFALCTGLCPNYDLQVRADGRIDLRRLSFDGADEFRQFRVSERKAAEFYHRIDALRPADGRDVDEANCAETLPPDQAQSHIDVKEIEIVWVTAQSAQHLEGCQTAARIETLGDALRIVGLRPDGSHIGA